MNLSDLPAVNACLNGASTVLLSAGYYYIRRKRALAHRNCMIAALVTSTLFLASYLYYHYHAGRTVFADPGWFRPIYLSILLTHTILAVVIVPLIIMTVSRAYRGHRGFALRGVSSDSETASGRQEAWSPHQRLGRLTLPLWLYVSVTGVVIYLLLYQIFPQK